MKAVLFHPRLDAARGAEKVVVQFARALEVAGWQASIACFDWSPDAFPELAGGLEVVRLPRPRHHLSGQPHAATLAALARLVDGADVAMAHNYPASCYLGHASGSARRVWYCHEPFRSLYVPETRPHLNAAVASGRLAARTPLGALYRRALRNARWNLRLNPRYRGKRAADLTGIAQLDAVAANSAATAAVVRAIYGRDASVLYPGVAVPATLPPAARAAATLRVLTMGGFSPLKGLALLLDGLERLLARPPARVVLEVVGDGRERQAIERRLAGSRAQAYVRFHGWLPEARLAALRAECHAFAALPADEPFGLVFAEAAAHGLVIVAPDHGGPSEIVSHGTSGILADPFDPDSVATALATLASLGTAGRARLREAAFEATRQRFDIAALPARLDCWLRGAGAAPPARAATAGPIG